MLAAAYERTAKSFAAAIGLHTAHFLIIQRRSRDAVSSIQCLAVNYLVSTTTVLRVNQEGRGDHI
jgi:hypothetical protein